MTSEDPQPDNEPFPRHGFASLPLPVVKGKLSHLRTKAEVQASNDTTSVYIVEIPNRSANKLLNVLRDVVPPDVTAALQHLRRFAKPEFLPSHLRIPENDGEEIKSDGEVTRSLRDSKSTTSHLLVCPTSTITLSALADLFNDALDLFSPLAPEIREIEVPVFAPTSAAQASEWSRRYWPTSYKNTNPYGPHPAMVGHAELELLADGDADRYMAMAERVGRDAAAVCCGREVGAVIVERRTEETLIVAVAMDARYTGINVRNGELENGAAKHVGPGNPMAHAVLRAISMVAQKRRCLAQRDEPAVVRDEAAFSKLLSGDMEADAFACQPLTETERHFLMQSDNILPDGYLCLDLEIYLTHEPCVMCAMAILHSRFSRVVFAKAMPKSGALSAETDSLGHGLFWRHQLNWKFLVWQWRLDEKAEAGDEHGDDFNA